MFLCVHLIIVFNYLVIIIFSFMQWLDLVLIKLSMISIFIFFVVNFSVFDFYAFAFGLYVNYSYSINFLGYLTY